MPATTSPSRRLAAMLAVVLAGLGAAPIARATPLSGAALLAPAIEPTGGVGLGGPAPVAPKRRRIVHAPSKTARGTWFHGVTVTEYWPAPESWFVGKLVTAPGLPSKHRIDWLYSAGGVSMQGQGLGLDGQTYHLAAAGNAGWVTASGHSTSPSDGWAAGAPFWRAGAFWRDPLGAVTFPLSAGGWYSGTGKRYVPLPGITFASGPALPLTFYGSIAVDPRVIPLGSRVYVPAYRNDGHGGWFIAQDTGGGVLGRHIDVYRTPPASSQDSGQYLTAQRIYVIKPKS